MFHFASFRLSRFTPLLLTPFLTACGSLTGLDAGSTFNCEKNGGLPCTSVEAIHLRHAERSLPYQLEERPNFVFESSLGEEALSSMPLPANESLDTQSTDKTEVPEKNSLTARTDDVAGKPLSAADLVKAAENRSIRPSSIRFVDANSDPASRGEAPTGRFPRRIPEVILRLWIAPWTDDDGSFHTAETLYVTVREARWAEARERRPAKRPAVRLERLGHPASQSGASAANETDDTSESNFDPTKSTENGRLLRDAQAAFTRVLEGDR